MASWPYNTGTWKRLRLAKLSAEPLCYACNLRGETRPAKAVDHVIAIAKGGKPFPPLDGLMSLCVRCHNEKTQAVDSGRDNVSGRRFKGFDVDGNPIDRADNWHGGGASNHENGLGRRPIGEIDIYLVSDRNEDDEPTGGFA